MVFKSQCANVRSERHFTHAIRVEVELIVINVLHGLVDVMDPLKGHSIFTPAHMGLSVLDNVLHSLHLHKVHDRILQIRTRKKFELLGCFLNLINSQQVLSRLGVQIAVLTI